MNHAFDSLTAYNAAVQLVALSAKRFNSDNLWRLLGAMDLESFGDSADPAMLDSWKGLWNGRDSATEHVLLDLIARFVMKEGIWDPADAGPQRLSNAIRLYLSGQLAESTFIEDWQRASSIALADKAQ